MTVALVPLKELATFDPPSPSRDLLSRGVSAAFAPMSSMSAETGELTTTAVKAALDCLKGYTYFQNRDVLVAKITPCLRTGRLVRPVYLIFTLLDQPSFMLSALTRTGLILGTFTIYFVHRVCELPVKSG
jgi:hypothetical protein